MTIGFKDNPHGTILFWEPIGAPIIWWGLHRYLGLVSSRRVGGLTGLVSSRKVFGQNLSLISGRKCLGPGPMPLGIFEGKPQKFVLLGKEATHSIVGKTKSAFIITGNIKIFNITALEK